MFQEDVENYLGRLSKEWRCWGVEENKSKLSTSITTYDTKCKLINHTLRHGGIIRLVREGRTEGTMYG